MVFNLSNSEACTLLLCISTRIASLMDDIDGTIDEDIKARKTKVLAETRELHKKFSEQFEAQK